jgi:FkbM family methyltransferase
MGLTGIGYKVIRKTFGDCTQRESKLAKALHEAVPEGCCVWDVGAHVGHYTSLLAQWTGHTGHVVAFEPIPATFRELLARTSVFPQVECRNVALGAHEQELVIDPGTFSPASSLIKMAPVGRGETVHVTTGEKLIQDGCPRPDVLKIDVEGFEEDVLWGLRRELRNTACRALFVEVHYSLLEQRGSLRAPDRILSLLKDSGFHTRWIDQSHLAAQRIKT